MNHKNAGVIATEERMRIGALLSRYPDNTEAELAEITNWFHRVATPLDIGMLASDPDIAAQYRAYRARYYDGFRPRDLVKAAAFLAVALTIIGAIGLLMP